MTATLSFTLLAVIPAWANQATAAPASTVATRSQAGSASAPTLKPALLPRATGAVPYSERFSASGGAGGPYTFGLDPTSKHLPPGLTLKIGGDLSGTPTQAGTFPIVVQVKDKAGNTRSNSYSLTVVPGISLKISGYVGSQCSVSGPFQSGSMTVSPFAFGPVKSIKGSVQVPGSNGPSLVTLSLKSLGSSGSLGLGWLTLINTTSAQCSALNPVFSLGRPTRVGIAAASGTGWFLATVNDVNYTLSVQFTVVGRV